MHCGKISSLITESLATLHSPVHLLIPALHLILRACKHLYSSYHAEIGVHDYVSCFSDLGNSPNTGFKGTVVVSMTYCAGKSEAKK